MAEPDLRAVAFPTLTDTQIAELGRCTSAVRKVYRDADTLFAVGDRNFKFHVVISGEVDIIDSSGDVPKSLTIHRKGGFTGDISHLTGNPSIVTAVAKGDCSASETSWPRTGSCSPGPISKPSLKWTRCSNSST